MEQAPPKVDPILCHTLPLLLTPPVVPQMAMTNDASYRPETLGHIDSETHPIRCHWADPADEPRCDLVLQTVETSWAVQIEELGFPQPFPDGDLGGSSAVDLYLSSEGTGGGAYALCTWTGKDPDSDCDDADPTDGRSGAAAFVVLDPAIPDDQLPGYVAHEFNHVLQYAIDFREPVLTLWEGTANAATWWTLGELNPRRPVRDFQRYSWLSLFGDGYVPYWLREVWMEPEYGAEIWFHHLEAAHGAHRGDATVRLWWSLAQEGPPNRPHLLDAWEEISGDWVGDLLAFATARGHVGGPTPPSWAEGWLGPDEAVTPRVLELHGDTTRWSPKRGPFPLGTIYVDLVGLTPGVSTTLEVRGEPGSRWGIASDHATDEGPDGAAITWIPEQSKARIAIVATQVDGLDLTAGDWYSFTRSLTRQPFELRVRRDLTAPEAPGQACGCQHGTTWLAWVWAALALRRRRHHAAARRGA